jgi:2-oxoglutarate dehydrogenase E2 component (dihydrolipoamide succinyltransferase)
VIETDKVTLEVNAEADGILKILVPAGKTVAVGAVVGTLEPIATSSEKKVESEVMPPDTEPETAAARNFIASQTKLTRRQRITKLDPIPLSPAVRRLVAEKNIDVTEISGTGPAGRITKGDVLLYLEKGTGSVPEKKPSSLIKRQAVSFSEASPEVRKAMTPIRKRIAERLLDAKQNTAMLTTFNEIDMSHVIEIRSQYKEIFAKKHHVSLGFMSFFTKACVAALKEVPEINAFIDDGDIVYHNYQHIGIAIGSDRGLVVPVIRHAEKLSFAEIEQAIVDYVDKIKENRLELSDLEGGTFTISNGGVYGSLLSTPILNTPQSGILGMHKIEKRPVVINDEIVIRPMMYVALSYDHRIVDGKDAVTFLKRIKEFMEDPERISLEV